MLHGNLQFYIGAVNYPSGVDTVVNIVIAIAVVCILLIATLAIVLLLYRRKVKGHQEDRNQLLLEMKNMEQDIAGQIRDGIKNIFLFLFYQFLLVILTNPMEVCFQLESSCKNVRLPLSNILSQSSFQVEKLMLNAGFFFLVFFKSYSFKSFIC